jgi:hypothetical protein
LRRSAFSEVYGTQRCAARAAQRSKAAHMLRCRSSAPPDVISAYAMVPMR